MTVKRILVCMGTVLTWSTTLSVPVTSPTLGKLAIKVSSKTRLGWYVYNIPIHISDKGCILCAGVCRGRCNRVVLSGPNNLRPAVSSPQESLKPDSEPTSRVLNSLVPSAKRRRASLPVCTSLACRQSGIEPGPPVPSPQLHCIVWTMVVITCQVSRISYFLRFVQ